ncbi:MAG: pilus assembly PilX N-terminal domain-containing protein, partial [Nitrospirota bacterium]
NRICGREEGVAMLTVLMLTIILTVIGIAAITTTGLDLWMAGGERVRESAVASEEACLSSGMSIIGQVLENAALPAAFTAVGANPAFPNTPFGMVLPANPLVDEIMGHYEGGLIPDPDTADPAATAATCLAVSCQPNAILTLPAYTVRMDIDRLYRRHVVGGPAEFGEGINIEILYRVSCYAINSSNQPVGSLSAVYVCYMRGPDRCQRQNI